jgi:hypothetical protein
MCVVAGTDYFGSATSVHPILNILSVSLASPPPRIERKPMADGWTWRPAMTLSRRCRHVLPATASFCISADYLDCGSISDAAKLHLYCAVADFASIQSGSDPLLLALPPLQIISLSQLVFNVEPTKLIASALMDMDRAS